MEHLKKLAQTMKAEARRTGKSQAPAGQTGLTLTLRYLNSSNTWILALTRCHVRPSDAEETLYRAAFEVPRNATRQPHVAQPYQITRFTWQAEAQPPPEPSAAQAELWPHLAQPDPRPSYD